MRHYFICFCFLGLSLSQSVGDFFLEKGLYYDATTEYKRAIFHKNGDLTKNSIGLATALSHEGELSESESLLLDLLAKPTTVSDRKNALTLLGNIHWDTYNYDAFRQVLNELEMMGLDHEAHHDIQYMRAWTYFYQSDWDNGLSVLAEDSSCVTSQSITQDILTVKSYKHTNPLKARWLSRIIPGWGQWYAGDRKNASISFLLVGGIGGSILWDVYQKAYATATMKFFLLYTRYAPGSIYRMETQILRENIDRTGDMLLEIVSKHQKPIDVFNDLFD